MRITNTALIWKSNDIDLNNGTVLHRITNNDTNLLIRADYGNASANSTIQFHVDADEKARITSVQMKKQESQVWVIYLWEKLQLLLVVQEQK
jgi:hypothetical protein